jgi:tetratricopeptide (TPR) repeat protein
MMFYREALRLNRDAYGMHHPDVAPILKSIGTILTKKGDYEDAYDVFRDVLSIKCTVHGTDHPEVASAYKSLGNVHYKLGDLADAERQYRHALSIYRRCKGEDHVDTIAAKTTIDHLRYWMKERDQRRQLEQRQSQCSSRDDGGVDADDFNDERSC